MSLIEKIQEELNEYRFISTHVPSLISELLQSQKWKYRDPAPNHLDPKEFDYFPNFVQEVRPWGLQTSYKEIENICSGFVKLELELGKLKSSKTTKKQDVKSLKMTEKQKNLQLLETQRPDLFQLVLSNKISVYRATIEGGLKKERISLKKTPESIGNFIMKNFSDDEKKELYQNFNLN